MTEIISVKEWFYLLLSCKVKEQYFYLPFNTDDQIFMDDYLSVRDEWIKNNMAELDFDGSLRITPSMRRKVLNLYEWRALTRFDHEDYSLLLISGPVDVLKVERNQDRVTAESISNTQFIQNESRSLFEKTAGEMTTLRRIDQEKLTTVFENYEPAGRELAAEIEKHYILHYEKVNGNE